MTNARSLYSVRMRAALGGEHGEGGRHVSGGERIVASGDLDGAVAQLLHKARARAVPPDFIQITVGRIDPRAIVTIPALTVRTIPAEDWTSAAVQAADILVDAGVARPLALKALQAITTGLGPYAAGIRGAALWDHKTGERLDSDHARGVRVTAIDYSPQGASATDAMLTHSGLTHFRTRDALAIASKVIWSGVIAELCWSDDPEYTTGYVATHSSGYFRITNFKPPAARGGRIFFVDRSKSDVADLIVRLEETPVLIDG